MNAITFGRNGGWARNPIDLKIERVSAINSVVEHDAWQVMTDWFTSPYWHAPPHLTEMLTVSKSEFEPITSSHFQLTESTASAAIRQIAGIKVDVDPVAFSLVDQFVFGNTIRGGARTLATSICRGERDDVVIELDSGHAATASFAVAMAWIIAESLRYGFPEEVTHGFRTLVCNFVDLDCRPNVNPDALAIPFTALVPLPAGIAVRGKVGGRRIAVPLPAYPLAAMVLPEHSPEMFPTYESLATLLADASLGERQGRLEPLGKWDVRWAEARNLMAHPIARPVSALVGVFARGLARSRDRVAASRVGPILVPSGPTLGWVWSLLRRASLVGRNPWLTRSGRSQLDQTAIMVRER